MKIFYNLHTLLRSITQTRIISCFVTVLLVLSSGKTFSQSYTFTPCGKTGQTGPSQIQANNTYSNTNLNGSVTIVGFGVQQFTVPVSGMYSIRARGGSGRSVNSVCTNTGGLGADMYGEFNLTAGQVLLILVGQEGSLSSGTGTSKDGGGGGGSFVTTSSSVALIVGGGGGGSTNNIGNCTGTQRNGVNASLTATATNGANGNGAGGVNGGGGTGTGGGAGGGFTTNGTGNSTSGGQSFMNGGTGGTYNTAGVGGFGGGGAGFWEGGNGGGGGGYSGGGTNSTLPYSGGGGGGSYNSGTNQTNAVSTVFGDGVVIITKLCAITINGTGVNTNSAICSGNSVTLTTNAVSNYSWSTGATTSSIVVSPTVTTVYTLGATSPSLCYTTETFTVNVNSAIPSLTVTNTANSGGICPNSTVNLTASGATTYTWTGGTTSVTNGVPFSPSTAASYSVTGGNACGTTTAVTSVSVHPFPTVNPVASTSTLCSGSSLTLTATGNATNYAWSGGSVPVGGGSFVPSSTTTYSVIGTSALSCTALATIPVTVYPTPINPPTANPALICIGGSSTLTATGASSYTWSSSSQTVNTANFIVTPGLGSTTYTCTKANSSCYNTQMVTVVTNSLPTIFAIVTPTVVCALTPATLAVGGAQTYTWTSPGPPTYTFTGASPVVSPVGPSTYTVAASDGTCINTTTVFLNANPNPTIAISASSPTICDGASVTMTASGGINYNWTITGGATLTGVSISHSPTAATAYNVTGDNSFGCTSGANQVVLVYPKPTLTVSTNKSLVCSGGSATLSATGANTYSWDPNANSVLTATALVNPTALTSSAVMYTVQGTNSGTGCQNTQTVLVNVYIPTLTISGNTNTCAGGLITLNSSGGNIGSYNWDIGDGNPHPTSNISATLAAPGVFTLSANSTSLGVTCPATETIALGIYYNPTITAVPERTLICLKESVGITADGGISYNWSNNMTGPTITITALSGIAANFTVTGTDANGCSSTATVLVKISTCAALSELMKENNDLIIYPNPNDGKFTLNSKTDIKLSLVNELGQLVRVINLTADNNHEVNVTDLAKGIYFVTGQKDNLQIYQKIVVTK